MPNRPKVAHEIRMNDRVLYKAHGWLVLESTTEQQKLGGPITRVTMQHLGTKQVDTFTFSASQPMVVY